MNVGCRDKSTETSQVGGENPHPLYLVPFTYVSGVAQDDLESNGRERSSKIDASSSRGEKDGSRENPNSVYNRRI